MNSPHLFWPSDRKLFRQRSRVRSTLALAVAVVATAGVIVLLRLVGMA